MENAMPVAPVERLVGRSVMVHFRCQCDTEDPRLSVAMDHVPAVDDIVSFVASNGQPTASRVIRRHWSVRADGYHVIVELL